MDNHEGETEKLIKNYLSRQGWDIVYKLSLSRSLSSGAAASQPLQAKISNIDWLIDITLSPDFEKIATDSARQAGLSITDPAGSMAEMAIRHEMGHWEYCPGDIIYHEVILDAISKGLVEGGLSEDSVKEKTGLVTNLFTDIVVNGINICTEEKPVFRNGLATFYAFQLISAKNHAATKKNGESDYYSIFVDMQMKMALGDAVIRNLAKTHTNNWASLEMESHALLKEMIGEDLAMKAASGNLTPSDREGIARALGNEAEWATKARSFGRIMAKHVKYTNNGGMRELVLPIPQERDRDEGTSAYRKKVIRKGLERIERARGGSIAEGGFDPGKELMYADRLEVMDEAYSMTAGRIVVEFMGQGGDIPRISLFQMAARRLRDREAPSGEMAWSKTMFTGTGNTQELRLFKREMPFDIDTPGASATGSYDDILFKLDTSASMGWSGMPLDGSKYDMCLRSVYAIIRYLEETGKAPYIHFGLMQFGASGKTEWSGWKGHEGLGGLKRQLFSGYQNAGATVLDQEKVAAALSGSRSRYLTIMATDGAIHNLDQAETACRQVLNAGNEFVLLQIDSNSEFADFMARNGAAVVDISKPEDLVGLTLGIAEAKYKYGKTTRNASTGPIGEMLPLRRTAAGDPGSRIKTKTGANQ